MRASPDPSPSYPELLRTAYQLGRTDGVLAADLEPADDPGPLRPCCQGRDGTEFARRLWGTGTGEPPAGLSLNAAVWYGQGFRDALAEVRSHPDGPAGRAPAAHQGPTGSRGA